jgi:hypothetical protein
MVAQYPEGRRKAVPTAPRERGGKPTTATAQVHQRNLFLEAADKPARGRSRYWDGPTRTPSPVCGAEGREPNPDRPCRR